MIECLADLAADSFLFLRDIGLDEDNRIIDDSIMDYLPVRKELYTPKNVADDISFLPFYEKIKHIFSEEKLLPSKDGYAHPNNAFLAYAANLTTIFNDEQLSILVDNSDARWILPSIGGETFYRARDDRYDYIRSIIQDDGILRDVDLIDCISEGFMETQSKEWILDFYEFLINVRTRCNAAKTKPIFISTDNRAVAAFDENEKQILTGTENKAKSAMVSLGKSKKHVLETSIMRFLRGWERIKDIQFIESDAISEIKDFSVDEALPIQIKVHNNLRDIKIVPKPFYKRAKK